MLVVKCAAGKHTLSIASRLRAQVVGVLDGVIRGIYFGCRMA